VSKFNFNSISFLLGRKKRIRFGLQRAFTLIELLVAVAIIGVTLSVAVPSYREYVDRVDVAQAIADMYRIDVAMATFETENTGRLPDSLAEIGMDGLPDPWGNPYQYLNLSNMKGKGAARKDHSLVPINSDYDLYSMGKDGKSVSPLTAKASRDDIVRANNGRFVGKASDY
jgi:general secretion pathway protein G